MNPLRSIFHKDVLKHPLVLMSLLAVALIALGSGIYYAVATQTPGGMWAAPATEPIAEVVTGTGTVEPAQNPDLALQSGGRIAAVNAAVGQHVSQGQVLVSLDQGTLAAQHAAAVANLKTQQAKLSQLQAGPRSVDVASKQTAVSSAQTDLSNLYASIPANLAQAYDKSFSGVGASTDGLFSQPHGAVPALAFQTTDSQVAINAGNERSLVNTDLSQWQQETGTLSSVSDSAAIEAELSASLAHLGTLRTYCDTLLTALNTGVATSNFTSAQIAAAQTSVGSLRDTINTTILSLQDLQQEIKTDKLAVQSAQDALNQTNAGATAQDIAAQEAQVEAAQANIESVNAQIRNGVVVAPYSGTVTSVSVKAGQTVAPNTVAVSLAPESALQVVVYLSEVDAAKVSPGADADVTLDAYGAGRVFSARVVSVDRSATDQSGIPAYKTTLQFQTDDPAITSGMSANATIYAAKKESALVVPRSAIITSGTESFVLVPGPNGPVQKQVTLGLKGTSTVEITGGLSTSDQFLVGTK